MFTGIKITKNRKCENIFSGSLGIVNLIYLICGNESDKNMSVIYNPECHSLYANRVTDENCLKRWFYVFDIANDKWVNVGVCSEYFRLVYQKHSREKFNYPLDRAIDEVLSPLFDYWVSYDDSIKALIGTTWKKRGFRYFSSIRINLEFVDRPKITRHINIIHALKIAQNFNYPSELMIEICYSLLIWAKSETLKKESKIKDLIRKAFGVRFYQNRIERPSSVDEINFTNLIIHLLNEQTNEK